MDFINRLREKHPRVKKQIAFGTSAAVTLMILSLWVTVFHFGAGRADQNVAAVAESSDTDVNPFTAFWNVLSKGWEGLAENIATLKSGANSAKEFVNEIARSASSTAAASADSAWRPTDEPRASDDVFILEAETQ